jgi:hypothetical protein
MVFRSAHTCRNENTDIETDMNSFEVGNDVLVFHKGKWMHAIISEEVRGGAACEIVVYSDEDSDFESSLVEVKVSNLHLALLKRDRVDIKIESEKGIRGESQWQWVRNAGMVVKALGTNGYKILLVLESGKKLQVFPPDCVRRSKASKITIKKKVKISVDGGRRSPQPSIYSSKASEIFKAKFFKTMKVCPCGNTRVWNTGEKLFACAMCRLAYYW